MRKPPATQLKSSKKLPMMQVLRREASETRKAL